MTARPHSGYTAADGGVAVIFLPDREK